MKPPARNRRNKNPFAAPSLFSFFADTSLPDRYVSLTPHTRPCLYTHHPEDTP